MKHYWYFFFEYEGEHKVSKRRRRKYEQKELEYQEAQEHFDKCHDLYSWHKMFSLVNLAVFNNMNKHLEGKLAKDIIEDRSLEVSCNIMRTLKRKIEKRKEWKIKKVSSYVYLPCLARFKKQWQFEDQLLDEDAYTKSDEEEETKYFEDENSYYQQGTGIFIL